MIDAFLTTATAATTMPARALVASLRRVHPSAAVLVLAADDAGPLSGDVEVWRTADLGRAAGFAVAETLDPRNQTAFCLPQALERALLDHASVVFLTPGLLALEPLDELARLLADHPLVLATHTPIIERYSTVPQLDASARHGHVASNRVVGVTTKAAEHLAFWRQAVQQTAFDGLQRRPADLAGVLPTRLLSWDGSTIAAERTLMSFTEYAAVRAGRAVGPACALVEADGLVDLARERAASTDPAAVELALLNANVHDSRPLLPLVREFEEALAATGPHLQSSRYDAFRRDLRLAADPLGRRWPAGDERGFDDWLAGTDRNGTTRLAHLWWVAHPGLQRLVPDPRRHPLPLKLWNERVGRRLLGVDLYAPGHETAGPLLPSRVEHALHWRANVVRGLLPGRPGGARGRRRTVHPGDVGAALRWRAVVVRDLVPGAQARRERLALAAPTVPAPLTAAPRRVEVERAPLVFGAPPRALTLMGLLRSESGLGQAARASLAALRLLERPFSYVDTSDLYPSRNSLDPGLPPERFGAHGDVNLIHANAGELVAWDNLVFRHRLGGRFNAAMCFWETANLPPYLRGVFDRVDELWLASEYLADVFGQYGRVPVRVVGLAADLPESRTPDRAALGLPADEMVFLFVYDALSAHGRKNPEKVVEAFAKAFGPSFDGVRLVIKVSNLNKFPASEAALRGLADRNRAVTLIDEYRSREDVLDLMAACDVYVSLHAAEGFGLTLLEAMALGTPVICTAYSGNLDFTTEANSWLVDYDLVTTRHQTGPYPPGSVWAAPRVDSAADLMRLARNSPAEVARKRERAAVDARAAASLPAYAQRLDAQLRRVL